MQLSKVSVKGTLAAVCIVLAGCGGGSHVHSVLVPSSTRQATTISPSSPNKDPEPLPAVTIGVTVPGLLVRYAVPTRYTCDGLNVSLPVQWSHIPPNTAEIALFVVAFKPVNDKFLLSWAVTGLSPKLHDLSAGELPSGTIVGRNSFGKEGYSICPERGKREAYVVKIIALPHRLKVAAGFDADVVYREAERMARFVGLATVNYKRSK
jgi:phosphatidylethanolamine-binding protein (PEBP) family uncharacterized protein